MTSDAQITSAILDGGLSPAHPIPGEVGHNIQIFPAGDAKNGDIDTSAPTSVPIDADNATGISFNSSHAEDGGSVEMAPLGAELSRKRKSLGNSPEADDTLQEQKKVKLDSDLTSQVKDSSLGRDKSLLPAEVWHHIFTFCPPKSLGNLLRANKLFNHYLDSSSSARSGFPVSVTATKSGLRPLKPNAIWQASRRLHWPTMPAPLRSNTELDMWRLACSPTCQNCNKTDARDHPINTSDSWLPGPGPNGVAVIWAFATRLCVSCLLQTSTKEVDILLSPTIPSAILPALPFVLLNQDLVIVPATMLESGQVPSDVRITRLYSSSDVQALEEEFSTVKAMGPGTVDEWLKGLKGRGDNLRHEASKWEKWETSGGLAKMSSQLYPGYEPPTFPPPGQDLSGNPPPASPSGSPSDPTAPVHPDQQSRQERTVEEVADLKAPKGTATPPEKAIKSEPLARQLETTLATTKEARDLVDKEWEEIQAPLRAKIAGYADEIIRERWDKGRKVSKDTSPKFATEVLIYVRKRFYEEVAGDSASARAAGREPVIDPPEGPFTQKLTLENMKWVFDTKIKPHTEAYRKELFFCNGCEGNYKTFGFEGVIQHYAAKHTTLLSVGTIVVHWRAEWPEQPPFASEGRPSRQTLFGRGHFSHSTPLPPSTYHYQPPPPQPVPQVFPAPSIPAYGAPYAEPYPHPTAPQHQPYPAQSTYPASYAPLAGYVSQQPYVPPASPYAPYQPSAGPYPPPPIGVDQAPPGYPPPPAGTYGYNYGSHQPNPQPSYPPPSSVPYPDTYQTKLEDIARNSREIWHALGSVKDLPGSARVFATIHHLVKRYRARFYETPPLTMFIDGLSNNKEMRPVRNVNDLVCKTCHLGLGNAASVEEHRKSFSLPQLANHFQSKHIEPMQHMDHQLDWVVDMVLIPDLDVISALMDSVGESYRSLLGDAFSEALRTRQVTASQPSYEQPQLGIVAYPTHPENAHVRPYEQLPAPKTSTNHAKGEGYHSNRRHVEEHAPESFSAPLQFNRSGGGPVESHTDGYLPDRPPIRSDFNGSTYGAGDGRSPQGPQPNRHENGSHKKKAGKNKRGKPQDRNEGNRRRQEEEAKRDEKEARREADEIQAMWAADRVGAARAYSSNKGGDQQDGKDRPFASQSFEEPRTRTPQEVQASHKNVVRPAATRPAKEEANLIAALEMHLDQGYPSGDSTHYQPSPSDAMYLDGRNSGVGAESRSTTRAYAQYSEEGQRSGSPTSYGSRYHQAPPAQPGRERSPRLQQPGPAYYPRPASPAERDEPSYGRFCARPEYPEQHVRYPDDRRYEAAPRPLDDYAHEAVARPEYARYVDDGPVPPRGAVELYEIVQVIDEQGEYFIRRPVRREAEASRYVYEGGGRAYRDVDVDRYAAGYEPVRAPAFRGSRLESRRPDVRADPAYQEEYDPRYPGV